MLCLKREGMMGAFRKLRRGREILVVLAILADAFKEIYEAGTLGYCQRRLFGWLPPDYKHDALAMAVLRLSRIGLIEKVVKDGEVYLRLSSLGWEKLREDLPLKFLSRRPWDKKWRLLVFDIEEAKRRVRDNFRTKLYELGFGQLQKSVYISAHPIEEEMEEFLQSIGLWGKALIFTAPTQDLELARGLAKKVWDLERLANGYQEITAKGEKLSLAKNGREIKSLRQKYLGLISIDPFLPRELLPAGWLAKKAESVLAALSVSTPN
jgi:phenylacetic acid degradation operon negative regulatory protein